MKKVFLIILLCGIIFGCNDLSFEEKPSPSQSTIIEEAMVSLYPGHDVRYYGTDVDNVNYYEISPIPEDLFFPGEERYLKECVKKAWFMDCEIVGIVRICYPYYGCIKWKIINPDRPCPNCKYY